MARETDARTEADAVVAILSREHRMVQAPGALALCFDCEDEWPCAVFQLLGLFAAARESAVIAATTIRFLHEHFRSVDAELAAAREEACDLPGHLNYDAQQEQVQTLEDDLAATAMLLQGERERANAATARVARLEDALAALLGAECLCPVRVDGTCNTVRHNTARAALAESPVVEGGAVMEFTEAEVEALADMLTAWIDEGFTTPPYTRAQYDVFAKLGLQHSREEVDWFSYDTRDPGPGKARDEPGSSTDDAAARAGGG